MKFLVVLIIVGLIIAGIVLLPDLIGRPSEAAVEEAVLTYVLGLPTPSWPFEGASLQWIQEVEVISIGEAYIDYGLYGEVKTWPVKVYLIGNQRREAVLTYIYKDQFRQWKAFGLQDIP